MLNLNCFKSCDIRGKISQQLTPIFSYNVAIAYAKIIKPKKIVIGHDARLSSPLLQEYFIKGLNISGVEVIDINLCGTEEIYYRCFSDYTIDGGIMITASHNPVDYNGIKMVGRGAKPISLNNQLALIRDHVQFNWIDNVLPKSHTKSKHTIDLDKTNYIKHLLSYINLSILRPLKILADPGNGTAGLVMKQLERHLPFEIIYINEKPDGDFPNGLPNPMIIDNRTHIAASVKKYKADLGIAWDGDFDRCFLFDEHGRFIEPYYLTGLLTKIFLTKYPGEKIIYDSRLTWNKIALAQTLGGLAVQSKVGHSFMKEIMRKENAIYGGEVSSHHYFRDFGYCDSGMIVWLIVAELISKSGQKLSSVIEPFRSSFQCSEEINYNTDKFEQIKEALINYFRNKYIKIDFIDGISMEFSLWRFNMRKSNTEDLVRINIETKDNKVSIENCLKKLQIIISQLTETL
ncbi:MAG: phosphomannomutase [Rickettsiaceae bacterium]|nr:phosphomannomutase [Rickettsiaceae bacterium]